MAGAAVSAAPDPLPVAPTPPPAPPVEQEEKRRKFPLVPIAIVLLVLAVGIGSFLLWPKLSKQNNATNNPPASGTSTPPATSQSQTQQQSQTQPQQPTETPPAQTNPQTNPPSTSAENPPPPATPQTAQQAIEAYYALIPNNLEAGYATLTDRFKAAKAETFQKYETWWRQYTAVQVSEPAPQGDNVVTVTLTYMQGGAVSSTERQTFTLVQQNGKWMIDSQVAG